MLIQLIIVHFLPCRFMLLNEYFYRQQHVSFFLFLSLSSGYKSGSYYLFDLWFFIYADFLYGLWFVVNRGSEAYDSFDLLWSVSWYELWFLICSYDLFSSFTYCLTEQWLIMALRCSFYVCRCLNQRIISTPWALALILKVMRLQQWQWCQQQ
jgi:hypothetical protein